MARHFLLYHSRASYRTNKRWVNFLFPLIICSEQKKIRSNICVSSRFQLDKYTQLEPHSHTRHYSFKYYFGRWLPFRMAACIRFDKSQLFLDVYNSTSCTIWYANCRSTNDVLWLLLFWACRVCVSMQREMSIQITSPFMCSVYYLRYYFFFYSLLVALESHCSRLCGAFSLLCRLFQES